MNRILKGWADRYEIPHDTAQQLHQLLSLRHDQEVKASNGDRHPSLKNSSKAAYADAWGKEIDITIQQIDALCKGINLVFDPGTGMWGSFKRDGRYIGDLPDT